MSSTPTYLLNFLLYSRNCTFRYYTVPPEQPICHLSAEIVTQMAKEFDIESFAAEERMMLDNVEAANKESAKEPVLFDSTGPVTSIMEVEIQKDAVSRRLFHPMF